MSTQVVILAAGQGKRMHSKQPKVLHPLAGKPILEHVLSTAMQISPEGEPIVIFGHQGELIRQVLNHHPVRWVEQKEQLGTGHALMQALPEMADDDQVLVLYGDVPLISEKTLHALLAATPKDGVGMLTVTVDNPKGYGRIKRDAKGDIVSIVEEKDATDAERAIREINPGIYVVPAHRLKKWLPVLKNQNAQQEYYLTDIIPLAVSENMKIHTAEPLHIEEVLGVNDRVQLAQLERFHQREAAENLMRQGVTLLDPSRIDIRGDVKVGRDVTIDVNVILEGHVVIGDDCMIGPNTILRNTHIGARCDIKANSVLDGVEIGNDAHIGPFARLRPGTVLGSNAHVGNFVEIKNSDIGNNSKINHLSYIGDCEMGARVNVGAGTITCNYDGANKHKTIIGDDVHIGSDTQLVAPVSIGAGATIAAGATVAKDAPANELTLTHRLEQRTVKDWQRPSKK